MSTSSAPASPIHRHETPPRLDTGHPTTPHRDRQEKSRSTSVSPGPQALLAGVSRDLEDKTYQRISHYSDLVFLVHSRILGADWFCTPVSSPSTRIIVSAEAGIV